MEGLEASTQPIQSYPGDQWHPSGILALAAAFLGVFPSVGLMVSIGTLQNYWHLHQLGHYTTQDIGWIPSIFVFVALALGILFGPIFDVYGHRWLLLISSVAFVTAVFLLAECKEYWQFLLCLGFLAGPAAGALMTGSLCIVSRWFQTRRGFAAGVAMGGSSLAGIVIPLTLRATFPSVGYAWSIRTIGLLFLVCLTLANVFTIPRMPGFSRSGKPEIFSLRLFRDPRFVFLTMGSFGSELVLFGSLGILPTYASRNMSWPADTGFYIVATLNAASCAGRILPGFFADVFGRFNVYTVMLGITLCFMLIIWLPFGSSSLASLYVFAALFGFGTGSWISLIPATLGQLSGPTDFGKYYGTCYAVVSVATLISIPLFGEILQTKGSIAMIAVMCAITGVSMVTLALSRWACLDWKWEWRAVV